MITAEQARKAATKRTISNRDIFESISKRADNGHLGDNFQVIITKEQIKTLEELGFKVEFSSTHTFIYW